MLAQLVGGFQYIQKLGGKKVVEASGFDEGLCHAVGKVDAGLCVIGCRHIRLNATNARNTQILLDLVRNRFDSYWRWYHGVAVLRLFSEVYIRALTILQLDDVEYEDWRRR